MELVAAGGRAFTCTKTYGIGVSVLGGHVFAVRNMHNTRLISYSRPPASGAPSSLPCSSLLLYYLRTFVAKLAYTTWASRIDALARQLALSHSTVNSLSASLLKNNLSDSAARQ